MTDKHCPRCGSHAPHLHPAMQHEGEVQPCEHPFHRQITPENTPAKVASAVRSARHGVAIIGPIVGPDWEHAVHIQCFCGWRQTGATKLTLDNFNEHSAKEGSGVTTVATGHVLKGRRTS